MRLFIGIIIFFTFLAACSSSETDNYEVGSDFLESDVVIRVLDTFTVNSGTFKLNDIITSSTGRILLGHINDENIGGLTSTSFFEVSNLTYKANDSEINDAVYDSIGFVMNYDSYHFGDTLQPQTYKFYKITEDVEADEDDNGTFLNTSTLTFDATETLGEVTFIPRPNRASDSLYIPFNDELGRQIFEGIQEEEINSDSDFLQILQGIAIVPDSTTNSHVLGFNTLPTENIANNSSLRVYYTIEDNISSDDDELPNYIDFTIRDISKAFNSISSNFENAALSTFADEFQDDENTVNSSETEELIYIQGGSGLSAKINMPSLKRLNLITEFGTALEAEITFKPLRASFTDRDDLQDSLAVFIIDNKNRRLSLLPDVALLTEGNNGSNDYFYSLDATDYVETILNSEIDLDYSLMFQLNDSNEAVESLVIQAGERNDDRVKLSVKYLNY